MRISDWSSDVCSSDLFSADGKAIDAVAPQQLIEGVRAVHEFTALAQAGSCHCSTSRDPPSRQADFTPRESRSEEHTSELQSLMRISYAVFCLKKQTIDSHSYTTSYLKN